MHGSLKKIYTLALYLKHSQVLLGMKKRGFGAGKWNGFGGKIQEGESIEQAACREINEEMGVEVLGLEERGQIDFYYPGNNAINETHIFNIAQITGAPKETEEMLPQWFDLDSIPYGQMWEADKIWLPIFLTGRNFKGAIDFSEDYKMLNHNIEILN